MILKQKGCYLNVFGQQFTQFPEFTGSKPEPVSFSDVPRQFRHRPAEGDNGQQLLPEICPSMVMICLTGSVVLSSGTYTQAHKDT